MNLNDLYQGLVALLKQQDPSLKGLLGSGAALVRIQRECNRALKDIKARLREHVGVTPGTHFLQAGSETCTVTVPEARPVVRQDADLNEVIRILGKDMNHVFEVKTILQPRPDFEERVVELEPYKAQVVLGAVDLVTDKARVSFKT